ncbi:MAG TPA: O-antigen ligase family protein [Oligoflexia bacterium]|nr:O-antigen ligase family protein [Oligoflexia bacterium]HMP49818.1 O-antigen ligase family protein [Oligoflexia bacterium]
MNPLKIEEEGNIHTSETLLKSLTSDVSGYRISKVLYILFFIHSAFLVMRFQDFPGMGWLGSIRVPGVFSLMMAVIGISFFFRFPQIRKVFFVLLVIPFIVFEAIRGVLGYTILQDWVLNDAWQFSAWIVIVTYFLSFMIPIVTFMSSGKGLRLIAGALVFCGMLLGIYSITHSGFGPGGHIGDENDHCLFLVSLLPFPFFYMSYKRGFGFSRLLGLLSFFMIFFGAIRTNSRGGFLGLVAVLAVFFLVSKRKLLWIISALVIALVSIPFIPDEYWGEVYSIKTDSTSKTGTMRERFDTWEIVYRMWRDPSNTVFGVGLENTKWNTYLYEPDGAGFTKKSLAGRATHSFYFQVLGDLGLWGVFIYGALIIHSLRSLRKLYKLGSFLESRVLSLKIIPDINGSQVGNVGESSKQDHTQLNRIRQILIGEARFLKGGAPALFSAWFGMLVSALGISVAYYPSFWMYTALTASFYLYGERVKRFCMEFEKLIVKDVKKESRLV